MSKTVPGTIEVVSKGECVECQTPFSRTTWIDPTHIAPLFFCPPGWVSFNVAIEEPVLPPNMEGLVQMQVQAMPKDMARDYLEGLKSTLPNFTMGLHMCPDCLEKGGSSKLLAAVKEAFHRSIEKEVSSEPSLPVILQFPHAPVRPVESDEE